MSSARLLSSLLLAALTIGCIHHSDDSPLVASVYGHDLHLSDLDGLVSEGISAEDSTAIVNNYIEQWIRQMVILSRAEKNIKDNFDRQIQDYKNSLLTYAYEQQIVNQLLDTNITDEQIRDYYDQHNDDFRLTNAIVKAVYVVVPTKSPALPKLKKIINQRNFDEGDVIDFEEIASHNGLTGYYDIDSWMPFYTLQSVVPIVTYNENLYLKQNHSIVLNDDDVTYLVRIVDYKMSNETPPLEIQKENIRSILLNQRKLEILNRLQADLLEEAEKSDNVKRYI
jgi:hypothetical protein